MQRRPQLLEPSFCREAERQETPLAKCIQHMNGIHHWHELHKSHKLQFRFIQALLNILSEICTFGGRYLLFKKKSENHMRVRLIDPLRCTRNM